MSSRRTAEQLGIVLVVAVAIAAGCAFDVVGVADGEGGSGETSKTHASTAGYTYASFASSGYFSATEATIVASASAGSTGTGVVDCTAFALADCEIAPDCVKLMRNNNIPPGTPIPPMPHEVDDGSCCWGCGQPTCTDCHEPVFVSCVDKSFCMGVPDPFCGYVPPCI